MIYHYLKLRKLIFIKITHKFRLRRKADARNEKILMCKYFLFRKYFSRDIQSTLSILNNKRINLFFFLRRRKKERRIEKTERENTKKAEGTICMIGTSKLVGILLSAVLVLVVHRHPRNLSPLFISCSIEFS